jgi:hypothetical protein
MSVAIISAVLTSVIMISDVLSVIMISDVLSVALAEFWFDGCIFY